MHREELAERRLRRLLPAREYLGPPNWKGLGRIIPWKSEIEHGPADALSLDL